MLTPDNEPFRPKSPAKIIQEAYWRPVWGDRMGGYEQMRDELRDGNRTFRHLDALQLVKHAFGLRTAVHQDRRFESRIPILVYLYATPESWPVGRAISAATHAKHRGEIAEFARMVEGDEVTFLSCSYREMLESWRSAGDVAIGAHADRLIDRFRP